MRTSRLYLRNGPSGPPTLWASGSPRPARHGCTAFCWLIHRSCRTGLERRNCSSSRCEHSGMYRSERRCIAALRRTAWIALRRMERELPGISACHRATRGGGARYQGPHLPAEPRRSDYLGPESDLVPPRGTGYQGGREASLPLSLYVVSPSRRMVEHVRRVREASHPVPPKLCACDAVRTMLPRPKRRSPPVPLSS